MEYTVSHNVRIEYVRGDITRQNDVEAVVNAANAELAPGGGVAGAIHAAAGPGLYNESASHAPIQPGEAVITGAFNLPNNYVIHCLGPRYGIDKPESELLAWCYKNALSCAEESGVSSVAFPAISTGAFGYPIEEAAKVAIAAVKQKTPELDSVTHVRFVLFSERGVRIFAKALDG